MGCVFCKIVAGTAPASIPYADSTTVAFLDINPMTPGHLLVVPRAHVDGLAELDAEAGAQLWRVGQRLAAALRRSPIRGPTGSTSSSPTGRRPGRRSGTYTCT